MIITYILWGWSGRPMWRRIMQGGPAVRTNGMAKRLDASHASYLVHINVLHGEKVFHNLFFSIIACVCQESLHERV